MRRRKMPTRTRCRRELSTLKNARQLLLCTVPYQGTVIASRRRLAGQPLPRRARAPSRALRPRERRRCCRASQTRRPRARRAGRWPSRRPARKRAAWARRCRVADGEDAADPHAEVLGEPAGATPLLASAQLTTRSVGRLRATALDRHRRLHAARSCRLRARQRGARAGSAQACPRWRLDGRTRRAGAAPSAGGRRPRRSGRGRFAASSRRRRSGDQLLERRQHVVSEVEGVEVPPSLPRTAAPLLYIPGLLEMSRPLAPCAEAGRRPVARRVGSRSPPPPGWPPARRASNDGLRRARCRPCRRG